MEFFRKVILLLACYTIFIGVAAAQSNSTPEDVGRRYLDEHRRNEEQRYLKEPLPVLNRKLAPEVKQKIDELCYKINSIKLFDNTKLSDEVLEEVYDPFIKKSCVTNTDIKNIITALNNNYINKGYVTSKVYIKDLDLSDAELKLRAVEGKVSDIIIRTDGKTNNLWQKIRNKLSLYTAFPNLNGKMLDIKDFEQGAEQINQVASTRAEVNLLPSANFGGTDVSVTKYPADNFRAYFGYDNFGQKTTGEQRAKLITEFYDLVGLNDSIVLSYITSYDTNALASGWTLPIGYWTHRLDYSYSEYLTVIDNISELFGTTWNASYTANRVLRRGMNSRLSAEAGLNLKESGRIINDIVLEPQPLSVARLGVKQIYQGNGYYGSLAVNYSKGLKQFGSQVDSDTIGASEPHAQFHKIDARIDLGKSLPQALLLETSVDLQYSWQSLYGSEQIVMGDYYSVRGFSGSNVAGDNGGFIRNDLTWNGGEDLENSKLRSVAKHLRPFIFFDAGSAALQGEDDYKTIAGAGFGIKFDIWRFSGDIGYATPVYASSDIEKNKREIYVTIMAKAF